MSDWLFRVVMRAKGRTSQSEVPCTLKMPNRPLRVESERQNLPIGGPCTLRMPNWPLRVESERQNLPIGGSCTLKCPIGLSGLRARGRTSQLEVHALSECPIGLSGWRARGRTSQSGGPCTLGMPNRPLRVESKRQNLPIGGSMHSQNAQLASQGGEREAEPPNWRSMHSLNEPLRVESERPSQLEASLGMGLSGE
jgi:hypothetical protein